MVKAIIERVVPVPVYRSALARGGGRVLLHYLHPGEAARFLGFRNRKRAWEWLGGRIAAKKALRAFMEGRAGVVLPFNEIIIGNDRQGRPFSNIARVHLSISHKETIALAAVADQDEVDGLGIDIERIAPRERAMWEQFFTAGEQELALGMASEQGIEESTYFTHLWAVKEAVLKALGLGLRVDTRQVEVASLSGYGRVDLALHDLDRLEAASRPVRAGRVSAWVREEQGYVVAYATLRSCGTRRSSWARGHHHGEARQ